jgi:hypothetical protein
MAIVVIVTAAPRIFSDFRHRRLIPAANSWLSTLAIGCRIASLELQDAPALVI